MDHAHMPHLTQFSLDCLHLMGFKEPCPIFPQHFVWDAKHFGIFQVLKIQHV